MDITKKFTDLHFLRILQQTFHSRRITDDMCKRVTALRIIDKDIRDLSGIEYFKNLEYLNIAYNSVRNLDLSQNRRLREVHCYKNQLEKICLPEIHINVISFYGNSITLQLGKYHADKVISDEKQLITQRVPRKKGRFTVQHKYYR